MAARTFTRRQAALSLAVSTLALSLAGCFGGSPATEQSTAPPVSSGAGEIPKKIGHPESPADQANNKADIKTFEAGSNGITVKLDVVPSENVRTILQTQLRSGKGPDVFGYDTGPGFAGALSKAGLVHDLTGAYEKYKWPVYDFAKQRVTFDGKLVGIPSQMEEVGVFYNKDIFAKLGLAEPQNLADLMSAATKIKDSGIIPMTLADKEGWEGGHLLSMSLSSEVGSAGMDKLLAGDTPWDDPSVVAALKVWSDMYDQKLLTPSPTAVTYDNANALFYSGKAAMNPTGSWLAQEIERQAKFEVGFIPFPSSKDKGIFSGGLGSGTFISATSQKVDASEQFLNYSMSPEHGKWAVEKLQDIPAYPVDTTGIKASPLFTQILNDTAKIADGTGDFGYNIDVLTNDAFNNAMWKGIQGLLSGQSDPEKVAGQLQKSFKKPTS
ncbi:MAG: extracellular solute-binding protein [Propionibacteriaceae bacterium]